jgi:hypothetical protein
VTYALLVAVVQQRVEGIGLLQPFLLRAAAGGLEALLEHVLELHRRAENVLGPSVERPEDVDLCALGSGCKRSGLGRGSGGRDAGPGRNAILTTACLVAMVGRARRGV